MATEKLLIYRIEDKYIRFLKTRDSKVQDNKNRRRPYVGVVLLVGGFRYFVPMESPKPHHAKMKPGKHLFMMEKGQKGLLGFNNMIPVPDTALIEFDIRKEQDDQYRELLLRQAQICNKNKAEIMHRASSTYFDVVNDKNKFLKSISCDFKKLEAACNVYKPDYQPKRAFAAPNQK